MWPTEPAAPQKHTASVRDEKCGVNGALHIVMALLGQVGQFHVGHGNCLCFAPLNGAACC
jgi:hypothetical protein